MSWFNETRMPNSVQPINHELSFDHDFTNCKIISAGNIKFSHTVQGINLLSTICMKHIPKVEGCTLFFQ